LAGKRELAAAVAIPIVLAILFFTPPIAFNILVAAVALCALWEFYRIAEKTGLPAAKTVGLLAGALVLQAGAIAFAGEIVIPGSPETFWILHSVGRGAVWGRSAFSFFLLLPALAALAPLLSGVAPPAALGGAASTVFGIFLIPLPAVTFCYLRSFSPRAVVFLFGVVWICDSCAYYGGKRWGKRKLAPVVSPHKTWEGTISGLVGATVFGAIAGTWILIPAFGPVWGAVAGALASTAGQLGDLVESMWKRGAGVKDSGAFLPGHGGFYDRIDSLLFAGPVLAAFLAALNPPV
jgi:phosphatidate cytidylyltransferase